MLELHIWGPAFGLPSIDAECLAAIHYLRTALPDNSWNLVPSSNPNLNPFQQLPALRDGSRWIAGLAHIQNYLADQSDGVWDIDRDLSDVERADCDAYSSFLLSRGLPLLDLSFYVSSDNYTTRTRSALSDLFAWPQSWTIPYQLRERAKKRSEHLGLGALDVDTAEAEENEGASLTAQIPKSLRKSKQTISGLLGRDAPKTRFRLKAVTDDLFEPLHTKLAGKEWLIADQITSADCLAIAIITLMQVPDLPQVWLREALSQKYPSLSKWAKSNASTTYGNATSVSSAVKGESAGSSLPWTAPPAPSWVEAGMFALEAVVSSVPVLRSGYIRQEVPEQKRNPKETPDQTHQMYTRMRGQQRLYSQVLMACISATSVLGWMAHAGLLALPRFQAAKPSRRNFGQAGVILGL